jgi:Relaxase/Mobilisation nuclease domain
LPRIISLFSFQATCRPVSISLSFAPGDRIDNLKKALIVDQVMDAMGYRDCQYLAITHHRDDPGHDLVHEHDHLHIVANAIDVYGERVSDSWDRFKIQPVLRAIEQEYGLQPVPNSWEVKRDRTQKDYPTTDLSLLVAESLVNCHDLKSWIDCLAQNNVDVRFALRKDGRVTGISYLLDGEIYKGSEIGASWAAVDRQLSTTAADYPLITAANAKSQDHQVKLSPVERQQLDHAVKMAITALNGKFRLKTGRLDLKLEDETLSVYRMRPHKQMFKMSKTPQGWEPVGFPNLDAKDLDLLSKISGMSKDFKVVPNLPVIEIESLPVDIVEVTPIPKVKVTNKTKASPINISTIKATSIHRKPIADGNPVNHIRQVLAIALDKEERPTPTPTPIITQPHLEPHTTQIVSEFERQQGLEQEAVELKPQQPKSRSTLQKQRYKEGR